MRYLELLAQERQLNNIKCGALLAVPKPIHPTIRFVDPEILKINNIAKVVCKYYGWSYQTVRSCNNNKHVGFCRRMIFFICVYLYGLPVRKVGRVVGKRDKDTVLKGRDIIYKRLQNEPAVAGDLRDIRSML